MKPRDVGEGGRGEREGEGEGGGEHEMRWGRACRTGREGAGIGARESGAGNWSSR